MQNRRSNKSEGRARRGKVALPVALVLAEIVLGGLVLALGSVFGGIVGFAVHLFAGK